MKEEFNETIKKLRQNINILEIEQKVIILKKLKEF